MEIVVPGDGELDDSVGVADGLVWLGDGVVGVGDGLVWLGDGDGDALRLGAGEGVASSSSLSAASSMAAARGSVTWWSSRSRSTARFSARTAAASCA